MKKLLLQMLGIAAAGVLLGLGLNALSPHPADLRTPVYSAAESGGSACTAPHDGPQAATGFQSISCSDATSMCTSCNAGFVDARPAAEFAAGHVPGSFHLPPHAHGDEAEVIAKLRAYPTVVVYDSGMACNLADAVATHLKSEGLKDVRILQGAWPAWESAGGPAESGACLACGAEEATR
jgi:rhodanese-related sulfurtransferase